MTWTVYDLSLDLVAAVAPVAARVAHVDVALAGQLRRAVASVPLNLAEGSGRAGRDRLHSYRVAFGSAKELRAGLAIAGRLGYAAVDEADGLADRVCAMLYRTARTRP